MGGERGGRGKGDGVKVCRGWGGESGGGVKGDGVEGWGGGVK